MSTKNAWGIEAKSAAAWATADVEVRISDCLLFALVPLAGIAVPRLGVPVNEAVALVILGFAAMRKPPPASRVPTTVMLGLATIITMLVLSGLLNDVDFVRRMGHLFIYAGLALALASGRISLPSAALGLGLGLLTISGLAMAGIGGRTYGDRLTGFFRDPNVAASLLTALGALAVGHTRSRAWRLIFLLTLPVALVLTYSRTGLLALGMMVLWALFGRRLGIKGGVALVAGLVWITANLPDSLRLVGPFQDREGSDALRNRIFAQERSLLDSASWYGNGPGTSVVSFGRDRFFFHNSYLSTLNEGGWVLLLIILGLMAYCFVQLAGAARAGDRRAIGSQAALIALLAMSVTLGEVFLELPTAIALGFCLRTATMVAAESTTGGPDG